MLTKRQSEVNFILPYCGLLVWITCVPHVASRLQHHDTIVSNPKDLIAFQAKESITFGWVSAHGVAQY